MNTPTHLLDSLADDQRPSPQRSATPPPQRPKRDPWRAVGKAFVILMTAGIVIAGVAGYQDAVDFLRGDHGDERAAASDPGRAITPDPDHAVELRKVLVDHRAAGEFVGARIALMDADGAITEVAEGATSTGTGSPAVDPATPWNIGSATKTFVAVVVMQLAEEGRLDIDDGIARWFPNLPQADRITPRMLLQHTSGLNEYIDSAAVQSDKRRRWAPSELIEVAEAAGRLGEPGGVHRYSNTNYIVLGELIRQITGRDWDEEVRLRITEPLGMDHTGMVSTGADGPIGYVEVNGTLVDATHVADPSIGGAAGALQSTGRDLLTFLVALEDGDLVSAETRRAMESFVPAEDLSRFGIEHTYGLGIERYRNDQITLIGHMGTGEAQSSYIGFDRAHRRAIAVQTNAAISGPAALMAVESLLAVNALPH